jgi:hypothetical protein
VYIAQNGAALLVSLHDGETSGSVNQAIIEEVRIQGSKLLPVARLPPPPGPRDHPSVCGVVCQAIDCEMDLVSCVKPSTDGLVPALAPSWSWSPQGLARVGKHADSQVRRLAPTAGNLLETLKESQALARRGRLNMWRYGDIDSDDEHGF